jgi:hypothetical protein
MRIPNQIKNTIGLARIQIYASGAFSVIVTICPFSFIWARSIVDSCGIKPYRSQTRRLRRRMPWRRYIGKEILPRKTR